MTNFENPNFEKAPKSEPTEEEIFGYLDQMLGLGNYKEIERKKDELGLRDLRLESKSEPGTCYEYSRRIDKNDVTRVTMDITYYNESGIPFNGEHIANYKDGKWIEV